MCERLHWNQEKEKEMKMESEFFYGRRPFTEKQDFVPLGVAILETEMLPAVFLSSRGEKVQCRAKKMQSKSAMCS